MADKTAAAPAGSAPAASLRPGPSRSTQPARASGPPLEEVLYPRSVAVVGASPPPPAGIDAPAINIGSSYISALQEMGFAGPIYPVNPKHREVLGLPCYPSLREVPGPVDYVQVNRSAEAVLPLLEECAQKGAKAVQFFTAGFSETGLPERAALEAELVARARRWGIRIVGPNCMGFINTRAGVSYMRGAPREPGPVGILTQSASLSEHIVLFGSLRGLRFSVVFNQGNAADINEAELLEHFARDPATEVIGAYVEGVREGRRFFGALQAAAARKPVVVYKGGQTEAGGRAVYGHTASLAGAIAVFDGLCRQAGALRVRAVEELVDLLVALRFLGEPGVPTSFPGRTWGAEPSGPRGRLGDRVVALGIGGGASVRAADELEAGGLRLLPLAREVQEALGRITPVPGNSLRNPIDAVPLLRPDYLRQALRIVAGDPGVDLILLHLGFGPRWGPRGRGFHRPPFPATLEALVQARQATGKPIALALFPPWAPEALEEFLAVQESLWRAGFPVFHSLERAARAIAHLLAWRARGEGREGGV